MLIKSATEAQDILIIAKLAQIIWNEHFTPIIGKAQVDYMLDKFQSEKSIVEQINQGFLYYLIQYDNDNIGYIGILPKPDELFLSKLYLLLSARNQGYGKTALAFIEQLALERGLNTITLTVNKYNTDTIRIYKKLGFETINAVVQDIGHNFVMDDYIMQKRLNTPLSHFN